MQGMETLQWILAILLVVFFGWLFLAFIMDHDDTRNDGPNGCVK